MMSFRVADEAAIRQKAQVGIMIGQTRESIKGNTTHGYESRSGEHRLFIERHPVEATVIRHSALNYPTSLKKPTLLYLWNSDGSGAIGQSTKGESMGTKGRTWDL
jgi:hypothetical protein